MRLQLILFHIFLHFWIIDKVKTAINSSSVQRDNQLNPSSDLRDQKASMTHVIAPAIGKTPFPHLHDEIRSSIYAFYPRFYPESYWKPACESWWNMKICNSAYFFEVWRKFRVQDVWIYRWFMQIMMRGKHIYVFMVSCGYIWILMCKTC